MRAICKKLSTLSPKILLYSVFMMSQFNKKGVSLPTNFTKVSCAVSNKKLSQRSSQTRVTLIQLSRRHKKYAVEYCSWTIGTIKPGIECWIAVAQLQYGAVENKLDSLKSAVNWLIENYLRVQTAGIKFRAGEDGCNYSIEKDYYSIQIDTTPNDCIASIQIGNQLDLAYFPEPISAIRYAFELILKLERFSVDCESEF